jgi:hypothetical protein
MVPKGWQESDTMKVMNAQSIGRAELDAVIAQLPDERTGNELIARYIRAGANGGGRHDARVKAGLSGAPVWALIGDLRGGGGIPGTAQGYNLPEEAVVAAVAFYAKHRPYIDAWLLINEDYFDDWEPPDAPNGRSE